MANDYIYHTIFTFVYSLKKHNYYLLLCSTFFALICNIYIPIGIADTNCELCQWPINPGKVCIFSNHSNGIGSTFMGQDPPQEFDFIVSSGGVLCRN